MKAATWLLALGTSTGVLVWLWIINPALVVVVIALCGIWVFAEVLDAHWGNDDLPISPRDEDVLAALEFETAYDVELDGGWAA